jgi:hypothetical protein
MKIMVVLFIVFGSFSMQIGALSFQTEGQVNLSKDKEESKNIERIEVYGKKPTRFYYREYIKAEENFVALYNELAKDRDFKIKCSLKKIRSRAKGRFCETGYKVRIVNQYKYGWKTDTREIAPRISERKEAQIEDAKKLVEQSPELLKALIAYTNARKAYNSHLKKKNYARR